VRARRRGGGDVATRGRSRRMLARAAQINGTGHARQSAHGAPRAPLSARLVRDGATGRARPLTRVIVDMILVSGMRGRENRRMARHTKRIRGNVSGTETVDDGRITRVAK